MSGKTVTKRELCESIASNAGCAQVTTKAIVQQFLDEMVKQLAKGNRIELRDFGVFGTRVRPATKARNPRTNGVVDINPLYCGSLAVIALYASNRPPTQASAS